MLLWAGGTEQSVESSEEENRANKNVSKTHATKELDALEKRGAQQWWFQLRKGEDCMYEGRKKESSLMIELNQILFFS